MKPSIYNTNEKLIKDYLYTMDTNYDLCLSRYLKSVHAQGRLKSEWMEDELEEANGYLEVIKKWLFPTNEEDLNFMSLEDIQVVETKLNMLMESNTTLFFLPVAQNFI